MGNKIHRIGVSVIREANDPLVETRISIGKAVVGDVDGVYLVFRGTPENTVQLLREALAIAEVALPAGKYKDMR